MLQGEEQEFEEVDQLGDNLAPVVGKEEYNSVHIISTVRIRIQHFPQCGSGFESMLCL